MENLPHPKDLDFNQENLAAAWKKWKKEFNLFLIATESDIKPDKVKTSMFLTCIGSKGRDIHSTLDFDSPDEEMNLQTVIEKFDAYCEPRKNITFLRHKFFTCGQAEHQKFDEYVVELRQKAQQCEFGNLTDSLTKDILICGIRDMRLRERLLREPNLDLQKTIQAGQSAEQTRLQSRMLNATSETRDNEISRVYSQHDRKGAKTQITRHMQSRHQNEQGGSDRKPAKFQVPSQHYVTNCHYYGYNHKRNKCPAFHKTCEKCKKQGHYAKMCKSRKFVHKVEIHTDDESDDDTHALEMITANNSRVYKIEKFKTPKDIWTVELKVNNSNVTFKIDTGADVTVLPFREYRNIIPKPQLQKTSTRLSAYNNTAIKVLGKCTAVIKYKELSKQIKFIVAKTNSHAVIDAKTAKDLNLIQRISKINSSNTNDIIEKGKESIAADTLSRAYLEQNTPEVPDEDMKSHIHAVIKNYPITDTKLKEYKEATADDPSLQTLVTYTRTEWPPKDKIPINIKPFFCNIE
ncbi:K02A2.6-like family member retr-1 [Octopus vulgaris]|uniref:K02A2.6-like family member retr-1 n=1 Tax=Octopus vulgaris TaxID=6645 RepID=A0AA36AGC0_OCTVU|nr:K02A2.6-like family member retr-1 [Octopus vulgaris]